MVTVREIVLIVATARDGVIGKDNKMPWHLPEDLAHFKALTSGHCIIMGRKTWASIGKPLPNRRSIVISRTPPVAGVTTGEPATDAHGVEWANSLESALALSQVVRNKPGTENEAWPVSPVFVIGGAQVYVEAMPLAHRIELTEIDADIEGDTWFPAIDRRQWQHEASDEPGSGVAHVSRSGLAYRFVRLRNTRPSA